MVALLDEPQADPAPINALLISERARQMGFQCCSRARAAMICSAATGVTGRCASSGMGLAAGVARAADASRRRWRARERPAARPVECGAAAPGKMFAYRGRRRGAPADLLPLVEHRLVRRGLYTARLSPQSRAPSVDTAEPLLASLRQIPDEHDPLQRMLFLETRHFLADHNLNYTDRAGMAVGCRGARAAARSRSGQVCRASFRRIDKQQGSVGKAIFKKAMEPYLPRDVIYRPKTRLRRAAAALAAQRAA